ncbi:MAG: glycosyltransferase family 4 protein [Actinobacteria bacterium]|nr:glycosyltransferase family 4 protein [Actinomycetota bacterium]
MIVVLCPHFAPDTAPTGEVFTRIVEGFVGAGEEVHVVTALPWYRGHAIEPGWSGRLVRRERTTWGTISRVHPFPGRDKSNLLRRTVGFALFSVVAGVCALMAGGVRHRPAAVISMSPPLTLGLIGWVVARLRRARAVFNIQDVFPDAAVETGAISNHRIISLARWLERVSYERSDAVVVLSEDMRANVAAKVAPRHRAKVAVIPNFVDTATIVPADRTTAFRRELMIGDEPVVMYAGNVGFSQSLGMLLEAARRIPDATFVVNGDGAARSALEAEAAELVNVRFSGYQPMDRLPEVLATGDIHVVPLRAGLGAVSVPSKTYSILAAGRCLVAAIDPGTEVTRILALSGAGVAVPPDDTDAFVAAIQGLVGDSGRRSSMGASGRRWVETHATPEGVSREYLSLVADLVSGRRRGTGTDDHT